MASVDDSGGGKKKSVNVDVNIVPFIDLMSVLIIFLLISAVWTQVSMIQIGSSVYGQKTSEDKPIPPPVAKVPFRVDVKPVGYNIVVGNQSTPIPKLNQEFDKDTLLTELKKIKELYPKKMDVIVTMDDELAYEHLIGAMDSLLAAEFPEIAIATAGAK